jgi:pimeloyl-ACP methyl ester carboxylesterase
MDRRGFMGAMAFTTMAGQVMAEQSGAVHAGDPQAELAGVGPEWIGARALAGGKGYAPGTLGQIHYRSVGEGSGTPFLLIHQTPIGFAQYVDVQPALARAGRRSIAPDNPGYGFSDPVPAGEVTVGDLADNLRALCRHLGLDRVVVVGHHTGAALAAAFAARYPQLASGVVLHGAPFYTAEERAARLARPAAGLPLGADGGHFGETFRSVGKWAGVDPQSLSSITWATLGTYLAGPDSPVYRAVFGHDMTADLLAIRAPTLLLTDTGDPLHANDRRVLQLRPDFTLQVFSGGGSFALMREPGRWARVLLDFVGSQRL